MLCVSILTVDVDKHFGNIGFFIDNDSQEVLEIAPIYDNNLALIPYYDEQYDGDMKAYVNSCCAKDGSDFIELYRRIKNKETDKLIRKALSFQFKSIVSSQKVDDERLKLLSEVVHYQAKRCLSI